MSSSSSVISRVGGYAPGWLADYATVGSALHANFSTLGPFSTSDVIVGVTYLWEIERNKRAETGVAEDPGIGPGPSFDELDDLRALCVATDVRSVSNPNCFCFVFFLCFFHSITFSFLPRAFLSSSYCPPRRPSISSMYHVHAPETTQAAYFAERDHLRAHVGRLGHEVLYSVHKSQFQEPAHYISLRRETGDVHFVIRGKDSNTSASGYYTRTVNSQFSHDDANHGCSERTYTRVRVLVRAFHICACTHVTQKINKNNTS